MTIVVDNEYYGFVPGRIQREIHQTKAIRLLEEGAALNIVRTADVLMVALMEALKPHMLSATQYNVLRILRGAGKDGVSCKDIGARLLARDPDITRLMDRLEQRGLIRRDRAVQDRRVVTHHLTEAGLPEQAVGYWLKAGLRSMERAANHEAIGHLSKGLTLLETLNAQMGKTVVMVTHDPVAVVRASITRHLDKGRLK